MKTLTVCPTVYGSSRSTTTRVSEPTTAVSSTAATRSQDPTQYPQVPLTFSDPLGQPVRLHAASVLTYADVARFSGGYLVLRRRPIITALAREAAVARHVQLIKQE